MWRNIKNMLIAGAIMFPSLPALASEVQHAEPQHKDLFVYEITCNPKKDEYRFEPSGGIHQDQLLRTPAYERLQKIGKGYGIFLNGEYVGQGPFTHSCLLQNEVTVETEIDYNKRSKPFLGILPPDARPIFSYHYLKYHSQVTIKKKDKTLWKSFMVTVPNQLKTRLFYSYTISSTNQTRCMKEFNYLHNKETGRCSPMQAIDGMIFSEEKWNRTERVIEEIKKKCKKIKDQTFDCTDVNVEKMREKNNG